MAIQLGVPGAAGGGGGGTPVSIAQGNGSVVVNPDGSVTVTVADDEVIAIQGENLNKPPQINWSNNISLRAILGVADAFNDIVTGASSGDFCLRATGGAAMQFGDQGGLAAMKYTSAGHLTLAHSSGRVGFFSGVPSAKQTGVAVSAAAIHAALVTYGLIAGP